MTVNGAIAKVSGRDQEAWRGPVFRFAPSPNGHLHLGHALSALLNHDLAAAAGGRALLRLEDIDRERCREVFVDSILEDLAWLECSWPEPPRRQSDHFGLYREALDGLAARNLLYPCFCTRGAVLVAPRFPAEAGACQRTTDPDGAPVYPGTCRRLSSEERARRLAAGHPAGLRLDMERALAAVPGALAWEEVGADGASREVRADPAAWGDALLARKTTPTSYHLSVVVDDAAQGVTDVVRGVDLFAATGLHRLLQALLGLAPPRYHHHRLVLDADGRKLSKSRGAPALRDLRARGVTPAEIRRTLGLAPTGA